MPKKSLKTNESERIIFLIEQAGTLMMTQRNHVRNLGNSTFDTIASHCYHVGIIAYSICRMEKLSHEDALRAMSMGVLHDLAEARTGDNDFITKNYTTMDEKSAIEDQFNGIDFGKDLKKDIDEYEERQSKLARCTKDADSLA